MSDNVHEKIDASIRNFEELGIDGVKTFNRVSISLLILFYAIVLGLVALYTWLSLSAGITMGIVAVLYMQHLYTRYQHIKTYLKERDTNA